MEAFNLALTHKENIKTFDDILRQLELEAEHRRTNSNATFVPIQNNASLQEKSTEDMESLLGNKMKSNCSKENQKAQCEQGQVQA